MERREVRPTRERGAAGCCHDDPEEAARFRVSSKVMGQPLRVFEGAVLVR